MLLFLHGEDTYRSRQKLNEIIKKFKKSDSSGLNIAVLDMEENSLEDFIKPVTVMPFMSKSRLVIVKNVLGNKDSDLRKKILDLLQNKKVPDTTTLVFFEYKKIDKRQSLFKFLKKESKSQEFYLLPEFELNSFVKKEVKDLGGKIDNTAVARLVLYVGNDLWKMSNEVRKLISYKFAKGKNLEIKVEDIDLLVKSKLDENIFHLVDAIGRKDRRESLRLLHENFEQGQNEQYLLAMISYQFRNLIQVKDLLARGNGQPEIKRKMKMHPFVVRKTSAQAAKFDLADLKNAYDKLLRTDFEMKTGRVEQRTALDLLVVELCG
ncbi:MAG: hypothetical protein ACD_63C00254G0005 [uncultured bacterium]|nr:MAG: hypothetical protein ACD_63C00254G0005 [uncultured bacterium]